MQRRRLPFVLVPLLLLVLAGLAGWLVLRDGVGGDGAGGGDAVDGGGAGTGEGDAGGAAHEPSRRRQRPGWIAGSVRVLATRDAAPGREVVLGLPDGTTRTARTGTDGGFEFRELAPGAPYEVRVEGPDHAPVARPGLLVAPGKGTDLGALWLADGVAVEIEVVSFTGEPLADAMVRAFSTGPGSPPFDTPTDPPAVAQVRTGADGVGRFGGLPPGTWTFTAERYGYARRGLVGVTVRAGLDVERFHLALEPGYRLHGRVLDDTGRPVPNAPVLAVRRTLPSDPTTAPLGQRTATARDGSFEFGALPAADVILWSGRPGAHLAILAAVRIPGVDDLDLVLPRGAVVSGLVTDADGAPVSTARVQVNLSVLGAFSLTLADDTDLDGRYTIDLPMAGSIQWLSAEASGCGTGWAELGREGELPAPEGARIELPVTLAAGGGVRGRVVGPDGPLANVEVGLTNPSSYYSTTSGSDGRFQLAGAPNGRYVILATRWGFRQPGRPDDPDGSLVRGDTPPELVVTLPDDAAREFELRMEAGATLRGRVELPDGKPAAGATVSCPWNTTAATTDADGRFELGPVETGGDVPLEVRLTGYATLSQSVSAGAADGSAAEVVLRLAPGTRIRGRVTSGPGRPLVGTYVQLVAWNDGLGHPVADEWNWLEARRLPVRADGTYDHPVTDVGTSFFVRAGALGHARATSGRIDISPEQPEVIVDLELPEGVSIGGRVVTPDGAGVARANVTAVQVAEGESGADYPGAWGPPIVAVADESGAFTISMLSPGSYLVRAWGDATLRAEKTIHVPEDDGVTIEVTAALAIEGTVRYADGAAAPSVAVRAESTSAGPSCVARTDRDGRFRVTGLSRGTYTLSVRAPHDTRENLVPVTRRDVEAGTTGLEIVAERGLEVAGRVRGANGVAVRGANVEVLDGDGSSLASANTDGGGGFSVLGLGPGSVSVRILAAELAGVGSFIVRNVAAGTTDVDIQFPEAARTTGTLVGPDGAPLGGRNLQLEPVLDVTQSGMEPWEAGVSTDDAGRFDVPTAPGARYRVHLADDSAFTLPNGTVLESGVRNVQLQAVTGETITGTVTLADGTPAANATVWASGERAQRTAQADERGAFTLTGLNAGATYSLSAGGEGWATVATVETTAPATGIALAAVRTYTVSGRVVDAAGRAAGPGVVWLNAKDGGSNSGTWIDDGGTFSFGGIAEGVYRVSFDRNDGSGAVECGEVRAGETDVVVRLPAR